MKRKKKFTKVCLKCGGTHLMHPALKPFAPKITGLGTWFSVIKMGGLATPGGASDYAGAYHCEECGWTGVPVEVENVEKFRKHLKKTRGK